MSGSGNENKNTEWTFKFIWTCTWWSLFTLSPSGWTFSVIFPDPYGSTTYLYSLAMLRGNVTPMEMTMWSLVVWKELHSLDSLPPSPCIQVNSQLDMVHVCLKKKPLDKKNYRTVCLLNFGCGFMRFPVRASGLNFTQEQAPSSDMGPMTASVRVSQAGDHAVCKNMDNLSLCG